MSKSPSVASLSPTYEDGAYRSDDKTISEDDDEDLEEEEEEEEELEGEVAKEDQDEPFQSSQPPYFPNQRVLCKDQNNEKHYYEAVVKKVKCVSEREWSFFVHYSGWNSRWDRWARKDETVDDTPANRKKYLKPKEVKKRKKEGETQSGTARKRKAADSVVKSLLYQEYCELPFTLRSVLLDEYEHITRQGFDSPPFRDLKPNKRPARSVHIFPAKVTVKQALQQYQKKRGGSSSDEVKQYNVRRFCTALGQVFDEALPVCLLYPEEVPQYKSMQHEGMFSDKRPCEVYGCEYLLRLMVRLPALAQGESRTEMDVMGPMIADLIVLLQKNRQACFKVAYREPKYDELLNFEKDLADRAKKLEQQQQKEEEKEKVVRNETTSPNKKKEKRNNDEETAVQQMETS